MGQTQRRSRADNLTPLVAPLKALQNLLAAFDQRGVIIGGIAASILGTPRYTVDLDAVFLLSVADLPKLLCAAAEQGILPRIPDAESFARKNRVLLLRHTVSGTDIDLSLGMLPFETEMVERSVVVDLGSVQLRLPTPEDLIILKAVAHRPKDLADIQGIAASHPNLDREQVRYWVEQFGEALELPELWETIAKLL
jgi:hypothetical protein